MARNGSSRSTAWTRSFEDLPVLETLIRFVNEDSAALQERLKRIHQAAESALENSSSHEVFFKDSEKTDQARKKALKNMEDMKILCRTFLEAIKLTNE